MTRWEYLCVDVPHDKVTKTKIAGQDSGRVDQAEAILNDLGSQGWELVGVRSGAMSARNQNTSFGLTLFLKRAKA